MPTDKQVSSGEKALENSQGSAAPVPAQRALWTRWWIWVPMILFLIIASFPSIVGSQWFYQPLVDRLAVQGFRLRIDEARIRWLQPLALRGVRIEQIDAPKLGGDAQGQTLDLVAIQAIESNRSLIGYLLGGRDLGRLRIIEPRVDIELLENTSSLEKLVDAVSNSSAKDVADQASKSAALDIVIEVEGLSVSVTGRDSPEPILVVPPFNTTVEYLARGGEPKLIVSPSDILDHVEVTPELVRLGLGRAIPLLAKSAWFDGRVSLQTERIEIPIDKPEASRGGGTLTLHEVRSGPAEPVVMSILEMIAKFRGKDPVYELVFIDGSKIDVKAVDGMIDHQGIEIGLPKVDPRLQMSSAGRVGIINQELDLKVGFPVPLEMLARRESVQQLGVPQITLPIRGTIEKPVVDWSAMRHESSDLMSLIAAALGDEAPGTAAAIDVLGAVTEGKADEAIGAAVDLVKELRRVRQERRARGSSSPDADPKLKEIDQQQSPPPPRRPLRDALKNLRGG
ncbi:MAG: hypothetical protein KGQ51_08675 [Planctomycetes bacterium]|nr:hypothetical protein [Planctomycetota bacterium]